MPPGRRGCMACCGTWWTRMWSGCRGAATWPSMRSSAPCARWWTVASHPTGCWPRRTTATLITASRLMRRKCRSRWPRSFGGPCRGGIAMARDPQDDLYEYDEKVVGIDERRRTGRQRSGQAGEEAPRPEFALHPAELPDPATIPPRRWLYGTQLVRGFVSVLVAPGGVGKSAYAMGMGMALVLGRALLGEHVFEAVKVAIVNLDDDMQELNRRTAALMLRHKVHRDDLLDRLYLDDGGERGLTIAEMGPDGFKIAYPDEEAIIKEITKHKISVIIVDPFAESHTLEENSNSLINKAAAAWRRVARKGNCAVLLVHHVRKGDVAGIDAARGAKALTDSARVGLLMTAMSPEDATSFDIADDDRWQYVRIDDAKRNMAPARQAKWLKLESVSLGNTSDTLYPHGDSVQAIAPWQPQTIWQRTSAEDLNMALDRIAAGVRPGVPFGPDRRGNSSRWVGQALMEVLGIDDKQAAQMVAAWLKTGLLVRDIYHDKKEGRE